MVCFKCIIGLETLWNEYLQKFRGTVKQTPSVDLALNLQLYASALWIG